MRWLRRLFRRKEREPDPRPPTDDEARLEVAMRAFETGNVVIGERDEDGNLHIREYPKDD